MAIDHLAPGEVTDIRLPGDQLQEAISTAVFKSPELEVMRLVLRADQRIPEHTAPGDMTVQGLDGSAEVAVDGRPRRVPAGHLLRLARGMRYEVRAAEDCVLLVTISMPPEPGTA